MAMAVLKRNSKLLADLVCRLLLKTLVRLLAVEGRLLAVNVLLESIL